MARYIPDDVLETIRQRADIVEVVQQYVPTLKRAGSLWKACCPFHHEKTPSFTVNPARGIYKCFGCGQGGNVFTFIREMEKLDFPNAAELLARKYNIIIPDTPPPNARFGRGRSAASSGSAESPESSYALRERLFLLHEKLAAWYASQLRDFPDSPVARYFATRGLPAETAARFSIGASPDSWDAAILFAKKEGFTEKELRLSGVVSTKPENETHIFDRFRNRLMFPIWNEQGRVVAFSARSIEADPGGWKYVNSPETPIFKKSRTLYALNFARRAISEKQCAVLCEGQLDVIAMHRAGCTNAVAPQGTAFGQEQASILGRYTQSICLALDNDKAGREAVFKDAAILLPKGFSLRVAVFPGAKDADELLKTQGADVLRETVEKADDFFEFAFRHITKDLDLDSPAGKAAAAAGIAAYLHLIDNPVTQGIYADWLAGKLSIAREFILAEIEKNRRTEQEKKERAAIYSSNAGRQEEKKETSSAASDFVRKEPPLSMRHAGLRQAFYELLSLLLVSEPHAQQAVGDLEAELLDESPAGRALETLVGAAMNGEWDEAPEQISMMMESRNIRDDEISGLLMREADVQPPADADRIYQGCLTAIRRTVLSDKKRRLIRHAMSLPDGSEEKKKLSEEISAISRKLLSGCS